MSTSLYRTIIVLLLFISCKTEISKEKLSVIDNIVLGQSSANLSKQMDSLLISHKRFCTKNVLNNFNDLLDDNNFINMYFTNTFNLSKYRNSFNENIGLLWPMTLTGTQNIVAIEVILGHTASPEFMWNTKDGKSGFNETLINQNINVNLIEDIKNLYISKYGQPTDTFSMSSHNVYIIKGNQIVVAGDPDRKGLNIKWETEFYTVTFFTGLDSYNSAYNQDGYADLIMSANGPGTNPFDVIKNGVKCHSYCYIEYKLNDKAVKDLKLDKKIL